jgi:hypothetical protein
MVLVQRLKEIVLILNADQNGLLSQYLIYLCIRGAKQIGSFAKSDDMNITIDKENTGFHLTSHFIMNSLYSLVLLSK